jgi:peptide deformylase
VKDKYNALEFEEEMERVIKNMLQDLKQDAGKRLMAVNIKPERVMVKYVLSDGATRVSDLAVNPQDEQRDDKTF